MISHTTLPSTLTSLRLHYFRVAHTVLLGPSVLPRSYPVRGIETNMEGPWVPAQHDRLDGLKAMRFAASSGSPKGQEVSKLIKALVRATAKVQSTVELAFSDNSSHSAVSYCHNLNYNTTDINGDDSDSSEEPLIRRRITTVSTVHGLAPIRSCVDFSRGLFGGLEGEVGVGVGEEADIGYDGRYDEDHTR